MFLHFAHQEVRVEYGGVIVDILRSDPDLCVSRQRGVCAPLVMSQHVKVPHIAPVWGVPVQGAMQVDVPRVCVDTKRPVSVELTSQRVADVGVTVCVRVVGLHL